MAESFVNVTEGSGKKLHTFNRTIGANSVEDEGVFLAENYLASYVISTPFAAAVSTATANSHLLQIMAGASLKVRIRRIEIWQNALATAVAIMDLRIYRLTTAGTGGGVAAVSPEDTADGGAGATAMVLPTAKGTEGVGLRAAAPTMVQTLAATALPLPPILVWDFDRPRSKPLIIPAGAANGIAIKNITAVAAGAVYINVDIDETNF